MIAFVVAAGFVVFSFLVGRAISPKPRIKLPRESSGFPPPPGPIPRPMNPPKPMVDHLAIGDRLVIERDEAGYYFAEFSNMRGCMTQGDTLEQVVEYAVDARLVWLEARESWKKEQGDGGCT